METVTSGRWLSVKDDSECGGAAGFCGEEISAGGGSGFGNGDAVGVVVGVFDGCGGCFRACVTTGVGGGGGEGGGDIAVNEGVINTGDGDGLGCIPVGGCCSKGVGA